MNLVSEVTPMSVTNTSTDVPTNNTSDEIVMLNWIIHFAEFYLPLIILGLGLPGNILSLCVLLNKSNRKKSTTIYMAALAVVDFLVLAVSLFLYWFFFNIMVNRDFQWACSVFRFLVQFLTQLSTYLVVLMTLERYLVIAHPLRVRHFITKRRILMSIALLVILLFLVNMHGFWTNKLVEVVGGSKQCLFVGTRLADLIQSYFYIIWVTGIPFVSLILLNVGLIKSLRRHHNTMRGTRSGHSQNYSVSTDKVGISTRPSKKGNGRQLTIMLLLVSFAFLFLSAPYRIDELIWRYVDFNYNSLMQTKRRVSYAVTHKIWYVNNAINFYLYLMGGSKFRKDFVNVFSSSQSSSTGTFR